MGVNMKVFWLLLSLTISVHATEFIEGIDYITLPDNNIKKNTKVTYFFSFGCHSCFLVNQMFRSIKKDDSYSINVEKCHIYTSPLSKYLSKAWVVANQLGIAERVDSLLFKGIENQTITNEAEVKEIFLIAGIPEEKFDSWINDPTVEEMVKQQCNHVRQLKISGIPAIVVGNKFLVKLSKFPWNDRQAFAERYQSLISELLEKIS